MATLQHAIAILGICIAVAVFVVYITLYHRTDFDDDDDVSRFDYKDSISSTIMNNFNAERIRHNLRSFTEEVHPAGTSANNRLADKIANKWRENGLEDVHFIKYNVLLSYPNYSNPNHVTVFDTQTGNTIFQTAGVSPVIFSEEQGEQGAGVQWLAYSADGTVEGDVVYCHYGSLDDFQRLRDLGISVQGKIALMRYNIQFRAAKVRNAYDNGAIGAILFSDPMEYAQDGTDPESVYPSTAFMPSGAVQRGSMQNFHGDALSPLYPARSDLFRSKTIDEVRKEGKIPSIPVLPMSYSDAYEILSLLDGPEVPNDWQGALNLTYRFGPGFKADNSNKQLKLRLSVHSQIITKEIRNIVGYIYGAKEPDEYVMLGNHYDAWVYGSIDPTGGTATLAEVARVFTHTMRETGWRPDRTLLFCAWDAEEYGLIGSTEFVEEFMDILSDRAIIYLNVDLIAANVTFNADTVPSLYDVVVSTSQKIPNPRKSEIDKGRTSVFDTWINRNPGKSHWLPNYPRMDIPGGSSDHSKFLEFLGVPVVDFRYHNVSQMYPLYHTLYETHFLNEHLTDPVNLSVHKAIGRYWAELARTFADAEILPFNVTNIAQRLLIDYIPQLKTEFEAVKRQSESQLQPAYSQLNNLENKAKEFVRRSVKFARELATVKSSANSMSAEKRTLVFARANRRLKAVERCFVNPRGMPESSAKRHVLFSRSTNDLYSSKTMTAVYDQLHKYMEVSTEEEKVIEGRKLAQEISIVQYSIQCAINTLNSII